MTESPVFSEGAVKVNAVLKNETLWLAQLTMPQLLGVDKVMEFKGEQK